MITFYDNPFSPFARKVRMALEFKNLAFESIDALALDEHERLLKVNPRAEVPVLVDGDVTVVNSADIAAYLEDRYPTPPLLPASARQRVVVRHWQRIADTVLDAIVHDMSLWVWPTHRRTDQPPPGLLEAGRHDLDTLLGRLDRALGDEGLLCGAPSIADFALFAHVSSLKLIGVSLDAFPNVSRWNGEMRAIPAVKADLDNVKQKAVERFGSGASPYEATKVIWRGDRIEWLLAQGFADWFQSEMEAGRVVVPRSV